MSVRENLDKAKKIITRSNFISCGIMIITYFLVPEDQFDKFWFLIAALLFAGAGIGMILFMRRIERKMSEKNIT